MFFLDTSDLATAQRPYKILISLMDKEEIGQPIVQDLLVDILWSFKNHTEKSEFSSDVCHFTFVLSFINRLKH